MYAYVCLSPLCDSVHGKGQHQLGLGACPKGTHNTSKLKETPLKLLSMYVCMKLLKFVLLTLAVAMAGVQQYPQIPSVDLKHIQ